MPETERAPAPTRDEILQSHLVAIRQEIHDLPGRIFGWFFGAGCVGALIVWVVVTFR
jgi:hypothetical protein